MSRKKESRREFISEVGGVAAAAVGTGVVGALITGCGDTPVDPGDEVFAAISGPTELQIPMLGGSVEGEFDSGGSSGPITHRVWTVDRENDGFRDFRHDLGEDANASHTFSRPGNHTMRVQVNSGETAHDTAEHNVLVHPPVLPGTDYPLLAFRRKELDDPEDFASLYLMQPDDPTRLTRLASSKTAFGRMSWEPGGRRLVFDKEHSILTYDFLTDEVKRISPNPGIEWMSSWNPKKDWIVYCDDTRTNGYYDELTVVRPDGSGHRHLSGDTFQDSFRGHNPSWSPTGERLASSGRHVVEGLEWPGDGQPWPVRRIAIYDNIFDAEDNVSDAGLIERTHLNSEERLRDFWQAYDPEHADVFYQYCWEGINGLAWSPDGEWIVYNCLFGIDMVGGNVLLKARVDGTGDIEVVANSSRISTDPCW